MYMQLKKLHTINFTDNYWYGKKETCLAVDVELTSIYTNFRKLKHGASASRVLDIEDQLWGLASTAKQT